MSLSVLRRLFKREPQTEDARSSLYNEMRASLEGYVSSMQEHNSYLEVETDSGSHHAQMLIHQAESYRTRYYQLRLQYEYTYGNVVEYQNRIDRYFRWANEHQVFLSIHQPHDEFTVNASFAKF